MRIIAHRGYSGKYPENTIIAFEQAILAGATAIECDVQEIDGEFYIFHDWSLDRLTNMQGPISLLSGKQLDEIRIQNIHKIPTLRGLFETVKDNVLVNLELKSIKNPVSLAALINSILNEFGTEIVFSSFDHPLLTKIRSLFRGSRHLNRIKYAGLISHLPTTGAQYAIELELDITAVDAYLVDEVFVKHAHQYNIEVWCYTVNEAPLIKKLECIGVDAIFSDRVSWAFETLRQ